MSTSGHNDTRILTTFLDVNGSYNGTMMYMNDSLDITEALWYLYNKFHGETNYLLIVLYVPVIALAVTANILVIAVVFKYHCMRSITNYFVVNLSVADLLVTTICMPVAVSQAVSIIWIHGEVMCKLSSYLQGVAVAASVFTITAMSIDRYLAISNPIKNRRVFNKKNTVLVIVALWLIALIIFAPVLRAMSLQSPGMELSNLTFLGPWKTARNISRARLPPAFHICAEDFKPLGIEAPIFGTVCFVLVYAIPGFVVILSYSMMSRTLCARRPPFDSDSAQGSASSQQSFKLVRERRRIAWILLLLAVLFALCWLPYNVLMLLIDLGAVEGKAISEGLSYCLFLGHANSALNPMVYCFMTRNFRRSVVEILRCGPYALARRRPRRGSVQVINKLCAGCRANGMKCGLLRQRKMQPKCECKSPSSDHHQAVSAFRRTPTSSSLYSYRRCFMLRRKLPPTDVELVQNVDKNRETSENLKDDSQPRVNTLITTDEQRCIQINNLA